VWIKKEFAAKPSEARSSAKSGTKNLKSSFSLPLQGEAGGRGVRVEFRLPSQSRAKSVRIFSNTLRQLEKERFGSPSARARQPR